MPAYLTLKAKPFDHYPEAEYDFCVEGNGTISVCDPRSGEYTRPSALAKEDKVRIVRLSTLSTRSGIDCEKS